MHYVQAAGLALAGLVAGLFIPSFALVILFVLGVLALLWVLHQKSKHIGSGTVEIGLLITLGIFYLPMMIGVAVRAFLPS